MEDGELVVNEIAPRPHNSGHWTMDGCTTSQFEQSVRAAMGWPLGSTLRNFDIVMTFFFLFFLSFNSNAIP